MIQITPTQDMKLIRDCVCHPSVYSRIADDSYPVSGEFVIPLGEGFYYLKAVEDGELLGVVLAVTENGISCSTHSFFLPAAYGKTVEALKKAMEWVTEHTPWECLTAWIPESNSLAKKMVEKAGFEEWRFIPRSWKKNGQLYGAHLYGWNRGANHG